MKFTTLFLTFMLLLAACTPTQAIVPTATVANLPPPTVATVSEATATPAPLVDTGNSQDFIWGCYFCGGTQVWSFTNGEAHQIDLPVAVATIYGYSPTTGNLLYSPPAEAMGGGPSQIAVNSLWVLNMTDGNTEAIFSDPVVVEADLAPDGEHFAYVLATATTYELRWGALDGTDKLLASDVAFTFSVSPTGEKVAFTRESNYGLPGVPGLYVVDVATGEEVMVTDADRGGSGSIDDKPVWSPSGQHVLLPTYGTMAAPGLVRAVADGSGAATLAFDPALANEDWYQTMLAAPYWVSNTQIFASGARGSMNQQMGGDLTLFLIQLNDTVDTIIAGVPIAEGIFVGWDQPGVSIWVQMGPEMQSIPLPSL